MNKPRLSNSLTEIGFLPVNPGNYMLLERVKGNTTVRVNFTAQQITVSVEGKRSITNDFKDGTQFWNILRTPLNS